MTTNLDVASLHEACPEDGENGLRGFSYVGRYRIMYYDKYEGVKDDRRTRKLLEIKLA